jgi:uncharacterized coiled-coil protein SlyX
MELEKFEELARKVEALLNRVENLAAMKIDLEARLQEKEGLIGSLNQKISTYEQERNQVRLKVDELLGRLDEHQNA